MGKKNELPVDMATALDCAIRDFEVAGDQTKFGYQIDGNDYPYNNYLSNTYWVSFLEEMSKHHRQQFDDGAGGELNEKKGRWGIYPPKMASYGSSSRLIYKLSKGTEGFIFEERLDTRVGGIANLDGLLHKGNKYIYVEAKRREIYGASHEKQEVKCVYFPVYNKISEICGSSRFRYEPKSEIIVSNGQETQKITFYIDDEPVKYFDLKQLICHFLGITYDIAKHSVKNPKVTFLYLLYNPSGVKDKIDPKFQKKVSDRYDEVKSFIDNNRDLFRSIFDLVLQYQVEIHKLEKPDIDFEFKLVDQYNYGKELN